MFFLFEKKGWLLIFLGVSLGTEQQPSTYRNLDLLPLSLYRTLNCDLLKTLLQTIRALQRLPLYITAVITFHSLQELNIFLP